MPPVTTTAVRAESGWQPILDIVEDAGFELRVLLSSLGSRASRHTPPPTAQHAGVHIAWPTKYQWALAAKWGDPVIDALALFARHAREPIPQPYDTVIVFHATVEGRRIAVALDYADDPERIVPECLDATSLYFKMQFWRNGYGDARIVPGLYVASQTRLGGLLPTLRRMADGPKRFDVWGRFSTRFAAELRTRAVALLSEQKRFGFEGGMRLVRFRRALRHLARSRVCVDLPGNGPLCFRLVE